MELAKKFFMPVGIYTVFLFAGVMLMACSGSQGSAASLLAKYDHNNNGVIERHEASDDIYDKFDDLDKNMDGLLNKSEFQNHLS